ncbi:unnamed protein product [Durusdinium trenchii]|uniref:Secreted protein n=1 Tax=Durusdinium trenchii TaxID=1381693 RepID=A0ABP0JCQ7_9DINO
MLKVLVVATFVRAWTFNASYTQFHGTGCSEGEREFKCQEQDDLICCQHSSQTVGWRCQGAYLDRVLFNSGEDCSGQAIEEVVGYLSLTADIARISAGECVDYGTTMSFRFTDVPTTAVPCGVMAAAKPRVLCMGLLVLMTMCRILMA